MPISVVLRKEDGTEVDRSKMSIQAASVPGLAQRIPMLRWLDVYGDTVYNGVQREVLSEELSAAIVESDDDHAVLQELLRLCEVGRKRPHRYLWFIGD
jgi:hypothetical protein